MFTVPYLVRVFAYFPIFQDLKSEKRRSQMQVARNVLEKYTMLLLTSSKVNSNFYVAATSSKFFFLDFIETS